MPKRIAPLTELEVCNVRKKERAYKLSDGVALYLEIMPAGGAQGAAAALGGGFAAIDADRLPEFLVLLYANVACLGPVARMRPGCRRSVP